MPDSSLKDIKNPRGRPEGWRKPEARRKVIMIRLNEDEYNKLSSEAELLKCSKSEVLRSLLYKIP